MDQVVSAKTRRSKHAWCLAQEPRSCCFGSSAPVALHRPECAVNGVQRGSVAQYFLAVDRLSKNAGRQNSSPNNDHWRAAAGAAQLRAWCKGGNAGGGAWVAIGELNTSRRSSVTRRLLMGCTRSPFNCHPARVKVCPERVEKLLRDYRSVEPTARDRQMGATAVTMLRMETMGQRGLPRTTQARGQRA